MQELHRRVAAEQGGVVCLAGLPQVSFVMAAVIFIAIMIALAGLFLRALFTGRIHRRAVPAGLRRVVRLVRRRLADPQQAASLRAGERAAAVAAVGVANSECDSERLRKLPMSLCYPLFAIPYCRTTSTEHFA